MNFSHQKMLQISWIRILFDAIKKTYTSKKFLNYLNTYNKIMKNTLMSRKDSSLTANRLKK